MITKTIFPGRYIQGLDALKRLKEEIERVGDMGFIVCDPFVFENPLPYSDTFMGDSSRNVVERFQGESSDEEIERLSDLAKNSKAQVIVGIGGGKTLDTAKAVAHLLELPVIVVPTIASTDAPCSALSVIYTPDGKFKRYLILPRNPDVVLVDIGVIARAPARFLVSGMGDALATWFEASSCKAKFAPNITGDVGSMTAYALARLCYDTLLEYGVAAKISCEAHAVTPALEHIVEANTLLSGLGFESGGLASAHAIHNGFTVLEKVHDQQHGEKVAFGTLASLFLTDKPGEIIDEVYVFCESVGLPTTFEGIGLGDVSDKELMKVAEAACAENETIHNEPIPVEPMTVFSALKAADAEGRRRKMAVVKDR
jgi:glycerol dehydrogenase